MAHAIVFFNADNYATYDLALVDGATYATASTIDATDNLTGILDTIELLTTVNTCLNDDTIDLAYGVIHKGVWVSLGTISETCERSKTGISPDMAIVLLYNELTAITVTFTLTELTELAHRINCANSPFLKAYPNDRYTDPMNSDDTSKLFHKLNALTRTFNL